MENLSARASMEATARDAKCNGCGIGFIAYCGATLCRKCHEAFLENYRKKLESQREIAKILEKSQHTGVTMQEGFGRGAPWDVEFDPTDHVHVESLSRKLAGLDPEMRITGKRYGIGINPWGRPLLRKVTC
jgi:hypothetical protein